MPKVEVVAADWIKRIAEEERQRDAVRAMEEDVVARKAELIRLNGQRLVDELRATVARDVIAFMNEFRAEGARHIDLEISPSGDGFVVSKPAPRAVSLAVMPNLDGATIKCRYSFAMGDGLPPRETKLELVFAGNAGEAESLHIRHHGTGQSFATPDALSEFLLVPVFTGRPR